jgi:hypothetical protein
MTDEEFETKDVLFSNGSFNLVDQSIHKYFLFYFKLVIYFIFKPHCRLLETEIWL